MAGKAHKKKPRKPLVGRVVLLLAIVGVLVAGGIAGGFVMGAVRDLPAISTIEPKPSMTSLIYGADGKEIAKLHGEENRIPIRLSQMPLHLQQATVAIEDHEFYEHRGINFRGLARVAYLILTKGQVQGGSTITQQLAKNAFLTNDVTVKRKVQDMILAVQLERLYTKPEIMEMYLNQIPFGNGAYGVEAASQVYFGKSASQLVVEESALLAGITNGPAIYDPFRHMDAAKERQKLVLQEMLSCKFISDQEYKRALAAPINLVKMEPKKDEPGAHFIDYVISYLLPRYGKEQVYNGGLKIYTTIDMRMQKAAEDAVKKVLDPPFPIKPGASYPEAAVIVMDAKSGYVKAMVGGRTHEKRLEFNRAVQAKRQPGSAFKPVIVYGAALDSGITPGTVMDDIPIEFPQGRGQPLWSPENYDNVYHGLVTVREAVEHSYNVTAVRVLERVGVEKGIDFAQKLGITTLVTSRTQAKNDLNLSVALGGLTQGVTPLEMAQAFGVYAAKGMRVEPIAILKVVDKNGTVLEESKPKRQLVVSETTAYMMTNLLQGVVQRGTGTRAAIGRPAAGKTGTTNDYRDAWFIGYTPDYVCSVWMGFDEDKTMEKWRVTGGTYPATIWSRVMTEVHKGVPVSNFTPVRDLTTVTICAKSGKLPGAWCPGDQVRTEVYLKGTQPVETCDVHVPAVVCAENPTKLATLFCRQKVLKGFIRRPVPYVTDDPKKRPLDADQELPVESCELHSPW